MMINVEQPQHAIVRDIIAEAGRPMHVAEIAAEFAKLGIPTRATALATVMNALGQRKKFAGDVCRVRRGVWEICKY
jgi:hypothetical protein